MISQNAKGQTSKQLSILITKQLQEIAKDCEGKVKIVLRDKLEETHKHDIYSTYAPIQMSGQKVQEYNATQKHQQKQPYHHSGTLISSVKGVIEGNVVKIEIEDKHYNDTDSTSVRDVYEWLDKGTSESENDLYILGGKGSHTPYVSYWPQPRHGFKKMTLDKMETFIKNELIPDIERGRYLRKTRKGAK